jgi:hypothetical protein
VIRYAGEKFPETQKVVDKINSIETVSKVGNTIFFYVNSGDYGKWWVEAAIMYKDFPAMTLVFYEKTINWG